MFRRRFCGRRCRGVCQCGLAGTYTAPPRLSFRLRAEAFRAPSPQPPAPTRPASSTSTASAATRERLRTGGVVLQGVDATDPGANAELWERVVAKLRAGSMPPAGSPRPDAATYEALAGRLEAALDRAWAARSEPWPNQRGPPPESHRVQERDPRSVRARRRRRDAPAGRRDGRRELRQLRRRADDFDGASRALPVGGAAGDAAGDRLAARERRPAAVRDPAARRAGRPAERGSCRSDRAAGSPSRITSP